jgi:VIT1/CCC1 family predicted Fe2+/Mn2+ transporter
VSLFSAVSSEDMQAARIVTGLTMAAFIAIGFVPRLRQRASIARGVLLAVYLAACAAFVGYVLVR